MIYIPSKDLKHPDLCFFISKDGYSTKIDRIGFSKEWKEPVASVFELKTTSIFLFSYHEGFFYLMDDSWNLKKLQYDRRTQKVNN
jgi:hypothetical protein